MMEQERDGKSREAFPLNYMLILLGILSVLAAGIWGYNLYRLKEITFEGLTRYTEEEFLEKLDKNFFTSLTPLFCLTDTFFQEEIPFVEKYEIDYVDRQTARILVHEKRVTGCVIIMGRYMFFDKDGIVVESSDSAIEGIPVVTGLKFNEIVLYQKLQVQKESLFTTILELARLIEQNNIPVKEISFGSGYDVTLYLEDFTVLLGKRTSYDEVIHALAGILESVSGRTGTLDMQNYTEDNGEVILKEQ